MLKYLILGQDSSFRLAKVFEHDGWIKVLELSLISINKNPTRVLASCNGLAAESFSQSMALEKLKSLFEKTLEK